MMDKVQSIWRDYAFRFPFADSAEHRYGYLSQVHGLALQVSTVMAPASRFLRYFHAEIVRGNQNFELHPQNMTRYVWKDASETFINSGTIQCLQSSSQAIVSLTCTTWKDVAK